MQPSLFELQNPLLSKLGTEWLESVPKLPGVIVFKNDAGIPLYVVSARNTYLALEKFFGADFSALPRIKRKLILETNKVEWMVSANKRAAEIRKKVLIKKFKPIYNQSVSSANPCYIDAKILASGMFLEVSDEEKSNHDWRFGAFSQQQKSRRALLAIARLLKLLEKRPGVPTEYLLPPELCKKSIPNTFHLELVRLGNRQRMNQFAQGIIDYFCGENDQIIDQLAAELLLRTDLTGFLYRSIEDDLFVLQRFFEREARKVRELLGRAQISEPYLRIKERLHMPSLYAR
jgi:excinuclease UvrABC nuclease subunit